MLLATLNTPDKFQHTAARRRLLSADRINGENHAVSTHSRAEAAADLTLIVGELTTCFNTQPRGGGCLFYLMTS